MTTIIHFACPRCGHEFEVEAAGKDFKPTKCPRCDEPLDRGSLDAALREAQASDPSTDPDMVWSDDWGWLHRLQAEKVSELEAACAAMRAALSVCQVESELLWQSEVLNGGNDGCRIARISDAAVKALTLAKQLGLEAKP